MEVREGVVRLEWSMFKSGGTFPYSGVRDRIRRGIYMLAEGNRGVL